MNAPEVTIRDCRLEDVDQVLEIWAGSGAMNTPTDNVEDVQRAIFEPMMEFLVAEADHRVVGTIMGGFDGWRGAISRLAVLAAYQRRGIGRTLSEEVLARFRHRGVKVVGAIVEGDHPWAMAYWHRSGFELDPRLAFFRYRL